MSQQELPNGQSNRARNTLKIGRLLSLVLLGGAGAGQGGFRDVWAMLHPHMLTDSENALAGQSFGPCPIKH